MRLGLHLRALRGTVVWAGCSPGRSGLLAGLAALVVRVAKVR